MISDSENINILWGALIVEELVRNGVTYFCISPGSRSTPLAVAVARNSKAHATVCYDERGASFHALGYARATGFPAAVITTSGTAVANCYPAVVEAFMDMVPMVVLTADRPPELRDTGANQTIYQPGMFGRYVDYEFDMPAPCTDVPPCTVLSIVDHAVFRASSVPMGPVHLNCMFREPLEPTKNRFPPDYIASMETWEKESSPWTTYEKGYVSSNDVVLEEVASKIKRARHGMLVLGNLGCNKDMHEAVKGLAGRIDWPVLADIRSGLRSGWQDKNLIAYYDQILLSDQVKERLNPDIILHIGGIPVSKRLVEFLRNAKPSHYIMINEHPFRHDPGGRVTYRIHCSVEKACRTISSMLGHAFRSNRPCCLKEQSDTVDRIVEEHIRATKEISEIAVARLVSQMIPERHGLFLANSMPVRDMDMYGDYKGNHVAIGVNRGASGIDGTIASAAGFAAGAGHPVTLVTGDLAFLHDLNSLSILRELEQPLTIVLINNRGGGIFSFLPISGHKDLFERYFGTPHGFCFKDAAQLFGIQYYSPSGTGEFVNSYREAVAKDHPSIIEIRTNRDDNLSYHLEVQERIKNALRSFPC